MKKKLVAHVKFTNCAWDADELVRCFNKYSEKYEAVLIWKSDTEGVFSDIPSFFTPTDDQMLQKIKELNPDVIHFHNKFINVENKTQLIQYHTPPEWTEWVDLSYKHKKLVLGQSWATLRQYSDCVPVPNIMDLDQKIFNLQTINTGDKIRIGFSPSNAGESGSMACKGKRDTDEILNKLKQRNSNVEIDLIYQVPLLDCLERKSKCDILIDECLTPGYHKCSIESWFLGKLTICSLSDEVINIVKRMINVDTIPIHNLWLDELETGLQNIINKGKEYILAEGVTTRKWAEQNWNPKMLIKKFENIYEQIY